MSGTTNVELDNKLASVKNFFGSRAFDMIPEKIKNGQSIIVNLQDSQHGGTHWACVIVLPKHVLYFCPFGGTADPKVVKMMEKSRGHRSLINTTSQYQDLSKDSCGHFCVFLIKRLSEGACLYDILYNELDPFASKRNERTVRRFWETL